MAYDTSALAMLREVLDEILASEEFNSQRKFAALDIAQCILQLASQGERDVQRIKAHVARILSMRDRAGINAVLIALLNPQQDRRLPLEQGAAGL